MNVCINKAHSIKNPERGRGYAMQWLLINHLKYVRIEVLRPRRPFDTANIHFVKKTINDMSSAWLGSIVHKDEVRVYNNLEAHHRLFKNRISIVMCVSIVFASKTCGDVRLPSIFAAADMDFFASKFANLFYAGDMIASYTFSADEDLKTITLYGKSRLIAEKNTPHSCCAYN